tara:strand:+ start:218 stop:505 length:288 start_codon:yes stop_codon:yes gene_type:complete
LSDFTLYEADHKHQAIAWGPMTKDEVLAQAFELILESDTHLSDDQLRAEWNLYFPDEGSNLHKATEGNWTFMTLLCNWLNEQREGYRYFFTEVVA